MRATFIQYGDFKEAHLRLVGGGGETYHAQRHSVDFVNALALAGNSVTVISVGAAVRYRDKLDTGVETIGVNLYSDVSLRELTTIVDETSPTCLILRTPQRSGTGVWFGP